MELDLIAHPRPLREMQAHATELENAGFGAAWITEAGRTAYLASAAAVMGTERMWIGTGIAIAFPRSPMVTAQIAWELAESSGGRFILGLGSQVKAHIERRYSSEFSPPGPRMREYLQAIKAIFRAFRGEEKLNFQGEFYSFSLLPRAFNPGPIECDDPPIFISAVGPVMSRVVGELADGVHVHPFHSPEYLRDVQRTAIEEGLAESGRPISEVTFQCPVMTVVGDRDEELERTREHARRMVGFYGTTRAYAGVFEYHGYTGLSAELHALQQRGDLEAMQQLVTDDVLDHYVVQANWNDLGQKIVERYRTVAPNVRITSYSAPETWNDPEARERWSQVARSMRASSAA